jgi:HlyD family secretion protein
VPTLRPGMTATVEIETANAENVVKVPIQAIVSRNAEKEKLALEKSQKPRGKGDAAQAAEPDKSEDEDEPDKRVDGVYVLREGRAVFTPLQTGISDDRFIAVKSGLESGVQVVTGPYQTLRTLESGKRIQEKKDSKGDKGGKGGT